MRFKQINLRKLWLSLLLLVGATASAIPGIQEVAGTEDDNVVEISTVDELKAFRDAVNSGNTYAGQTVKLTADLDLSGESNWTPIGNLVAYPSQSFNGTFDGDGHSISNVTVNDNTPNHAVAGLFGSVVNGTIKNLTVKNVNLTSTHYAGGIVAYTSNGPTIENCKVIGGTIKSTPEIVDGSYDNGDKIGGIMGYATAGSTINNCWVEGVTLSAYRDLGGIVGFSAGTVTNNTAKNVTVTQDLTNGYKNPTPTTIGDIIGRDGGATLSNNKVIKSDPVAQIGETKYETIADAVAAANAGDVIEVIKAGDYTLPNISKNVTIEGAVDGVVFNHTTAGSVASIPNGATFKNVTFNFGNVNYHGFQHAGTINMEDCTLNGKLFSYGDMNFTDCSFNQSYEDYHMWTYAGNVTYDNCTFTNSLTGKFLNVYNESGATKYTVTVNNCKFTNNASANKAALNVKATSGSNLLAYDVIINNCTTEGAFPEASTSDVLVVLNSVAQVDDRPSNGVDNITVTQDGVLIYPAAVAAIGETKYPTLQAAVDAAQQMGGAVTVNIIDDISGETVTIKEVANFKLTIDGKKDASSNYTVDALFVVDGLRGNGGSTTNGASVTLQNIAFVKTTATDGIQASHYPHHLTIQDCTYIGSDNDKWFLNASVDGPLYGVTIKNVTVEKARLIYANMAEDAVFQNITATNDCTVGFNVKTSGTALIENCQVTTGKYAFRDYSDAYEGTFTLKDNTFVSTSEASDEGVIVSRGGSDGSAHIVIESGTYTGHIKALSGKEGVLAISGGYFSEEFPQEYIAANLDKVCVPATDMEGYFTLGDPHYVAQIGETKYVSLQAAINAAHETTGDVTITLIDDITGYSIVHQKTGLNLTIDGAEKTVAGQIIIDGDGGLDGTDALTIQNIKFEMPSELCTGTDAFVVVPSTKTTGTPYYDPSHNNHAHNITISDCTFTGNYPTSDMVGFKSHSGTDGMKNLIMENVTATNLHSLAQLTATKGATFDNCTATLTGSFIAVNGGDGTYTVNNCTFESHPDKTDGYAYREKSSSTAVATLTNNNFKAHDAIILGSAGTINIESGTYVGEISKTAGTIAISGGKFSAQLGNEAYADFIAEGFMGMNNIYSDEATPNGVVSTDKAVMYTATNGNVTFYDAIPSAFSASGTYKLLKDITRTTRMTPGIMATDVTLDLNGHTLTSTATDCAILLSRAGTSSSPKTFNLIDTSDEKGGKLVVNPAANTAIQVSGKYNDVTIGESVTIDGNCVALLSENQTLTVNGAINGGNDFAVATNGSTTKNATIIINEGAVLTSDETAMYLPGNEGLTATINGGTITGGKTGVEIRAGQLVVNGGDITSTATEYSYTPNGSGTTTKGAAIAVVQHTTLLPIDAQILGGTLTGLNQIAVVDAQENNLEGVSVKAKDELTATTTVPEDFKWASNGDGTSSLVQKTYVAQIGDAKYESLAAAVAAVPADGTETTIEMIANEMIDVVGSAITIPTNKNIVIDLNGFQVVGTAAGGSTSALITNKGTLTIKDNSDTNKDGTGTGQLISGATTTWIYEGDGNYAGSYASNTITNSGTLTIESGYVENLSTGSATYAVDNNSSGGNAILNMNGGLLKARSVAVRQFANSTTLKNEVNVAGGTVTAGYSGIWIQLPGSDATKAMKASLNVTGGTLTGGSYAFYDYSYGNSFDATQYNLDGGTFDGAIFSYGANINITDGTYNGEVAIKQAKPSNVAVSGGKFGDDVYTYGDNASEGFITGGVFAINTYEYEGNTYDCDWLNCLAEDYVVSDNTDPETKDAYPYAVRQANYICAIGTTKYETLADAVAAAGTAATTITLLTEAATDGVISGDGVVVPSGSNITFDLNGLTYNVSGETVGSSGTKTSGFQLLQGSDITFKNGTLKATSPTAQMLIQNYSNLTLEDVNLDGTALSGWAYALSNNCGTINLTGSTSITAKSGGRAFDTCKFGSYAIPTVNINTTGAITGPIEATGGKLNIENGKFDVTWVTDNNYAAGDIQIKGGVFSAEPAEEYCASGYVTTDNEDEATKADYPFAVMTKEDAGIFELIDGEIYPYLDYTEDKEAASVTYKRNFKNNNWQALFIPFDINDITELTDRYEFAKIHMVALENDGTFTTGNKIEIYYTRVTSGKISANQPYLIKAKNTGWQNIVVENTILKDTHNMTPRKTSTMAADYIFTGTYEGYVGQKYHDFMAMGTGTINWGNTGHSVGTYRWYIKAEPFNDDYAKATISFIEADEDATSISAANADENTEIEGYYSVNGVRSDVPVKGMNIVKYKNGKTKKIMIK